MRADERQAAVAYAYAWWTLGDDDAAATVLREAMGAPDPAGDSDEIRLVALMRAVRSALGDQRSMPAPSELALLHDGFDVPLSAAAELAQVPRDETPAALAHGRLEALLETVREEFRHPERLGGLALGADDDLAHAEECRSCSRARALIDRGRVELREVSSVSAPPGLIGSLVAEFSPPPIEAPRRVVATPPAEPELETAPDTVEAPEDLQVEAPPDEAVVVKPEAPPAPDAESDLEPAPAPELEPQPTPDAEPDLEPDRELEQVPPARRRGAWVLAGAGVLTMSVLVGVLIASGGDEQPSVDQTEATPTDRPRTGNGNNGEDNGETESEGPLGPDPGQRNGFAVVDAGLLLSGEEQMTPSGATVGRQDSLRVAVDYENGTKGVRLDALWRVDDEVYERLHAVVAAKASRHVWGVPVPADGWPVGDHRIVITANDTVAGAIDFTVRDSN